MGTTLEIPEIPCSPKNPKNQKILRLKLSESVIISMFKLNKISAKGQRKKYEGRKPGIFAETVDYLHW